MFGAVHADKTLSRKASRVSCDVRATGAAHRHAREVVQEDTHGVRFQQPGADEAYWPSQTHATNALSAGSAALSAATCASPTTPPHVMAAAARVAALSRLEHGVARQSNGMHGDWSGSLPDMRAALLVVGSPPVSAGADLSHSPPPFALVNGLHGVEDNMDTGEELSPSSQKRKATDAGSALRHDRRLRAHRSGLRRSLAHLKQALFGGRTASIPRIMNGAFNVSTTSTSAFNVSTTSTGAFNVSTTSMCRRHPRGRPQRDAKWSSRHLLPEGRMSVPAAIVCSP
jgi:hypothetical protein